ncbi:MAG: hypothetical protein K2N12_04500 [Helicobacter sp.]|nr:hypothetical protein [Helicobacter sp.]
MEDDDKQKQEHEQEMQQERLRKKEQLEHALSDLKTQYGIQGIHERTYIAVFKIEAILNKDYEQFDRTTAIGFIRILEREYNLNLSAWIEDYDDYCQAHGLLKTDEYDTTFTDVNVKIDHYEKRASPKWLNIAIGIIVLLVIGGYLAFHYLDTDNALSILDSNTTKHENPSEPNANEQETSESEDEGEETINQETNQTEDNTTAPKETNSTTATAPVAPVAAATSAPNVKPNAETNATSKTQTLTFNVGNDIAGRQLWIGVLYVSSKRRVHQIVTNELNLNVKEPMLFVTGHGRFSVGVDGNLQKLNYAAPIYLYYAPDEGVRVISEAEFREINGGRGW